MGNWIGPENRGNLMGIWSGNANLGNIVGYQIGAITIDYYGWGYEYCLLVAAGFQMLMCIGIWVGLYAYPMKLGIDIQQIRNSQVE